MTAIGDSMDELLCSKDKPKGNYLECRTGRYTSGKHRKIKWEEILRSNVPLITLFEGEKRIVSKKQWKVSGSEISRLKAKSYSSF